MSIRAKIFYKVFQMMYNRAYGTNPLEDPMAYQEKFLLTELDHQAQTVYGQQYGFSEIKSIADYQQHVPLTTYKDYLPYYERIKQGEPDILFRDKQLAWLATSAMTGDPKLIPYTDRLKQNLTIGPISVYLSYIAEDPREHLQCLSGKLLTLAADPELDHINDLPVGWGSGVACVENAKSRFASKIFVPPVDILKEKDWHKRFWETSKQVIKQNVSMIGGVPAYIVSYLVKLNKEHKHQLGLGDKTIPEIWPKLKLVIWGGAQIGGYLPRLRELLGDQVDFYELYAASETGLIAHQQGNEPGMVPILGNNFMEFIPLSEWRAMEEEKGNYQDFEFTCHTFQDVKPGVEYVIVFTTSNGLYRYVIEDTVMFHKSDIPRFNWSGRLVWYSNVTLERVYYSEVEEAIQIAEDVLGCPISNFSYTATHEPEPQYQFVIESDAPVPEEVAKVVDEQLKQVNYNYNYCRNAKMLKEPTIDVVPFGTYESLETEHIKEMAGKIGQYKPPRFTDMETLETIRSVGQKVEKLPGFKKKE
ncbi:MAG: GH3 auxin-responsive promoter family protein [Promethearchaeota archaeon]